MEKLKSAQNGAPKNMQKDAEDNFGKYLEYGTKVIMDITSSPEVDDEEKRLLVEAFSNELNTNVGNADNMKPAGPLLYGISAQYVDWKINEEFSGRHLTSEGCENGIKLCRRQKDLFKLFEEQGWEIPELKISDPTLYEEKFQNYKEGLSIGDRIMEEDKKLDCLIQKAKDEVSIEYCDKALVLLEELEEDLSAYEKKGFVPSNIFNKKPENIRKQIGKIREQAEYKEELYEKLHDTDYEIYAIASQRGTTEQQWLDVVSLCQKQSGLIVACNKRGWPLPELKYSNIDELKERYRHYTKMVEMDRLISTKKDILSERSCKELQSVYEDFYAMCKKQRNNIDVCNHNSWYVPTLEVSDPIAISEAIRLRKEKENKGRSIRKLTVAVILVTCSAIIGFFAYKQGKVQIPFDSSYVEGEDYDDLYKELEEAGFENISKKEDDSGWLRDGVVTSVTIAGTSGFNQGEYKKPDVDVVIYCSSKGRKDISKILERWDKHNYEELGEKLRSAGFSNLSYLEEETFDSDVNLLVSSVSPNGMSYTSGSCYIPPKAPIVIRYYSLKIKMEKAASKFVGNEYSGVVAGLRERGFTNIELQRTDDLKLGVFKKEGEIRSIRIDGDSSFGKDTVFNYFAKVVIVVNTFPGSGCDDITIIAN